MSASLTRRWKKWMAVGCSHGHLACPKALRTVLKFKSEFRPDKTLHLGDYVDLAALRGGAHGTKDEAADIDHDLKCGTNFVEELEPDILFDGNHEDRLERMCDHPKAIVSYCAGKIVGEINDFCRRGKIERVPYGIHVGWRRLGDHLFGHGYMFSEAAIKDHSESIGNCVIAHLHRSGMERARRLDGATGYCVGSLADIPAMAYAKTKRSTLKWNLGFAWGEYCEGATPARSATTVNLIKRADNGAWRLP